MRGLVLFIVVILLLAGCSWQASAVGSGDSSTSEFHVLNFYLGRRDFAPLADPQASLGIEARLAFLRNLSALTSPVVGLDLIPGRLILLNDTVLEASFGGFMSVGDGLAVGNDSFAFELPFLTQDISFLWLSFAPVAQDVFLSNQDIVVSRDPSPFFQHYRPFYFGFSVNPPFNMSNSDTKDYVSFTSELIFQTSYQLEFAEELQAGYRAFYNSTYFQATLWCYCNDRESEEILHLAPFTLASLDSVATLTTISNESLWPAFVPTTPGVGTDGTANPHQQTTGRDLRDRVLEICSVVIGTVVIVVLGLLLKRKLSSSSGASSPVQLPPLDDLGFAPIHYEVANDNKEYMDQVPSSMLDYADKSGNTPLMIATSCLHVRLVKKLLGLGVEVNAQNILGQTALHIACCSSAPESRTLASYLLLARTRLDIVDATHSSAFHYACEIGAVDTVSEFVAHGVNLNITDDEGRTGFIRAAVHGKVDILRLLIQKRLVKSNYQDNRGYSALHWAVATGEEECVDVLISSPKIIIALKDNEGFTPVHVAAKEGNSRILSMMLNHCSSGTVLALLGGGGSAPQEASPIDLARSHGHAECLKILTSYFGDSLPLGGGHDEEAVCEKRPSSSRGGRDPSVEHALSMRRQDMMDQTCLPHAVPPEKVETMILERAPPSPRPIPPPSERSLSSSGPASPHGMDSDHDVHRPPSSSTPWSPTLSHSLSPHTIISSDDELFHPGKRFHNMESELSDLEEIFFNEDPFPPLFEPNESSV